MIEFIAPTLTAFITGFCFGLAWRHWAKVEK